MSTPNSATKRRSEYGPHTDEILLVVALLTAPGNQPLAKLTSDMQPAIDLDTQARNAARAALQATGRANPAQELTGYDLPGNLSHGLSSMAIKDRIGYSHPNPWGRKLYLGKKQYNYLTYQLRAFLEIATATTSGTPERALVSDLVASGATIKEALATSKRALLI